MLPACPVCSPDYHHSSLTPPYPRIPRSRLVTHYPHRADIRPCASTQVRQSELGGSLGRLRLSGDVLYGPLPFRSFHLPICRKYCIVSDRDRVIGITAKQATADDEKTALLEAHRIYTLKLYSSQPRGFVDVSPYHIARGFSEGSHLHSFTEPSS